MRKFWSSPLHNAYENLAIATDEIKRLCNVKTKLCTRIKGLEAENEALKTEFNQASKLLDDALRTIHDLEDTNEALKAERIYPSICLGSVHIRQNEDGSFSPLVEDVEALRADAERTYEVMWGFLKTEREWRFEDNPDIGACESAESIDMLKHTVIEAIDKARGK